MSLYNMLFNANPYSIVILEMIDLKIEDFGRFRDVYIKDDVIIVYTRNGGGNRESLQHIYKAISRHPNYLMDCDDSYDKTYAYIYFSVPDEYIQIGKKIQEMQPPIETIQEKFERAFKEMDEKIEGKK